MNKPNDSVVFMVTVCMNEHRWGCRATWHGWRRLPMLGGCINVLAPSATVFFCGWQIMFGRLLVTMEHDYCVPMDEWAGQAKEADA